MPYRGGPYGRRPSSNGSIDNGYAGGRGFGNGSRGGMASSRGGYRGGYGYRRGGGGRHSQEIRNGSWVSPEAREHDEYRLVRNEMQWNYPHSDIVRFTKEGYLEHKAAIKQIFKAELESKLQAKEDDQKFPLMALFDGMPLIGNRSAILREKTIWCPDFMNGKEEIAPWPTYGEMKWEGDDRAKTFVGRFLPLPRERGIPGIVWGQLTVVPQYPLDQVAKIPTLEDTHLPVDEIPLDKVYNLLNKSLVEAIGGWYTWEDYGVPASATRAIEYI